MTRTNNPSPPLPVPASMSHAHNTQQAVSRTRGESETDVLMMDDVQFTASLDRLLDSELVNSAYNNNNNSNNNASGGQPQVVSTDPSVASTISSSNSAKRAQTTTATTSMPASITTNTTSLAPPPPQKPLAHPGNNTGASTSTLLPPPSLPNHVAAMAPSTITQRLAFAMPPMAAPSMMLSQHQQQQQQQRGQKRARNNTNASSSFAISEDESERERRRRDRNEREQQRSRRVTEQISHLRTVLVDGGVPCKPDKNSTLISVADYIQQLQSRSNLLDAEHKKLLDTIARTNEMVNNQYYQATTADGTTLSTTSSSSTTSTPPANVSHDLLSDGNAAGPLEDENDVFVQGLDYKSVFDKCGIALAVSSIDGRFIDANAEFVTLCGYTRAELLPGEQQSSTNKKASGEEEAPPRNLSLFNLLNREDMEKVFSAMSGMLRRPVVKTVSAVPEGASSPALDCWSGAVRQNREETKSIQLRMNITLVRTPGGRPKFFNCSLTTTSD